ncbi:hypothetical protein PC116_g4395 [Phytophthora cactorum]|uniref:Reverse transcriptase/retrotransposon-derived protein RNase H-like domain-containing protein n=1 Tax=Phytophthora cactorum TaxID=29920 RepID=A0A329RZC0_9STRA|nr:hypothetical protein Pcac1_g13139 [Phytophthora cactorum]KAG2889823.1 hypothetical protein PC114_g17760 [Phytophthora cactorum]KAG2900282.1 hypothetical protein PC117_g21998 [Phytophthora cactorum]KAG2936024.1 hypothetical protein PC115_g4728 [Phytophthora cactorum]KAG2978551.1 hypothetical protein PC119_g21739 [Phytophthora cactorum]
MMATVYERAVGRKKNQARTIKPSDVGWGDKEDACLDRCKTAFQNELQLAHPNPDKRLSVYTDASDEHWGAAIAQISRDQASRLLSEQEHEPLTMLSGSFRDPTNDGPS